VIILLREVPVMLTFFTVSCDPSLDMMIFSFVTVRILFLLFLVYKTYIFLSSGGNMRDYVIEQAAYGYLERMDAGLGVKVNDTRRYQWWPDSMKPADYKDMERIDLELKQLEEELQH